MLLKLHDADAADDVNHTYPIPNEESGRLTLVRKSNSSSVNYFGYTTWISLAYRGELATQ